LDNRRLLVVADDFGIGPATSEGILDLAARGRVTATVLLVNSPHAEAAVAAWRDAGRPLALGWHPCLTLDRPVLPPHRVRSLVRPEGYFWPLGGFLRRLALRQLRREEIEDELAAQHRRFLDLVGEPPALVNAHHHVQIFPPVAAALEGLLAGRQRMPYVRRVREPWRTLWAIPGARRKRGFLSLLGRRAARRLDRAGFPGNDWLAGITDPEWVADPDFLVRWLRHLPGQVVELACHPGFLDTTLVGRDAPSGGPLLRRPREYRLLRDARFAAACRAAGFRLASPADVARRPARGETTIPAPAPPLDVAQPVGAAGGGRLDGGRGRREFAVPGDAAPA
jgi:hypothetical protein